MPFKNWFKQAARYGCFTCSGAYLAILSPVPFQLSPFLKSQRLAQKSGGANDTNICAFGISCLTEQLLLLKNQVLVLSAAVVDPGEEEIPPPSPQEACLDLPPTLGYNFYTQANLLLHFSVLLK